MSPNHLVGWTTVVALVIVLGLAAGQVLRAVRELKRVQARVDGYADLPIVKALERGEADVRRVEAALAQVEPLARRVPPALAVIRQGPVPPDLVAAVARLSAEIAAFRHLAR